MYKYYRIIELPAKKTQKCFSLSHDSNDIYHYQPKKNLVPNDIYSGILPECLDTNEMEHYCSIEKNRKKITSFQYQFSYYDKPTTERKKNPHQAFQGYTDYLIRVTFKKNDTQRFRENFYKNGFYYEDRHYVRYKRSAGNAKENRCLFILKDLYDCHMHKWNLHYLDEKKIDDWTSFEAYSALTLSSTQYYFEIPRESILIMEDVESISNDKAITLSSLQQLNINSTNIRDSFTTNVSVSNTIWDGEALIDESVFNFTSLTSISDKHMLLLRNHYFKTCAFRTKLQKWFNDNHITDVKQLNGFTLAKSISDIRLVFTRSSLKYLKVNPFSSLEEGYRRWIGNQKKIKFGIIKTDKSPFHMNGHMIRTNYQLLNTIGLTTSECKELLKPSLCYLERIKQSPQFLRHYINAELHHSNHQNKDIGLDYQYDIFTNLIMRTNSFSGTNMYSNFLHNLTYNYREKLLQGKILVEGTNATLFGNPAEFLYATIHPGYNAGDTIKDSQNNIIKTLEGNEIHCSRFDEEDLCCSRSPHITMGNILLGHNKPLPLADYFVLSDNIVCINAINNNILQQLNGADYDSDFMLVTNNTILVSAIKRQGTFPIPYNNLNPTPFKAKSEVRHEILAEIDSLLSHDLTGTIVNLSQIYNSLWWTEINKLCKKNNIDLNSFWHENSDEGNEDTDSIYSQICKLAILSNIAIDMAKRHYVYDIYKELNTLRRDELIYSSDTNGISHNNYELLINDYPHFFEKIFETAPKRINSEIEKLLNDSDFKKILVNSHMELAFKRTYQHADSTCTMALIYNIITDKHYKDFQADIAKSIQKEFESDTRIEKKHCKIHLCDLICLPIKTSRNDGTQRDNIKKLVFDTYQQIKPSSNIQYIDKLDILSICRKKVEKLLNGKYYHNKIYLLLKDIDNDIKTFHRGSYTQKQLNEIEEKDRYYSLLFALICFAKDKNGNSLFYPLVEEKATLQQKNPQYRIVEQQDLPHSTILNCGYELQQIDLKTSD